MSFVEEKELKNGVEGKPRSEGSVSDSWVRLSKNSSSLKCEHGTSKMNKTSGMRC